MNEGHSTERIGLLPDDEEQPLRDDSRIALPQLADLPKDEAKADRLKTDSLKQVEQGTQVTTAPTSKQRETTEPAAGAPMSRSERYRTIAKQLISGAIVFMLMKFAVTALIGDEALDTADSKPTLTATLTKMLRSIVQMLDAYLPFILGFAIVAAAITIVLNALVGDE